jgi:DNA-binding MarR family transcriptional regulator
VFKKIFTRVHKEIQIQLVELKQHIKQAHLRVRDEFDDHRDAINENTNEIQANYEFLCKIDSKIDKMNERIDELALAMQHHHRPEKQFHVEQLTKHEARVFTAVYMMTDKEEFITYKHIARRLGLTEQLVAAYITNLIEKGIPMYKKYENNKVLLTLCSAFKAVQAKENILGLTPVADML